MQLPGFTKAFPVVPHDTNPFLPGFTVKGLWCGTAGTITLVPSMNKGVAVVFTVVAGSYLPISVNRVNLTGTTATLIVAIGD